MCDMHRNVTSCDLAALVQERSRSSALKDEGKCVQLMLWGSKLGLLRKQLIT